MTERINHYLKWLSLSILLIQTASLHAENVSIKHLNTELRDQNYVVDIKFHINLNEEAIEALHHGISLHLNIVVQLRKKYLWYWDKLISEINLGYILQHQPLLESYIVNDQQNNLRKSYLELDHALADIATTSDLILSPQTQIDDNAKYTARAKMYLNLDFLPPPMQLQAYFSPAWDITSEWHEWTLYHGKQQ